MGSSIDHSLRGSRSRSLALLIAAASLVVLAFLAAHARSAGATGATPTITSVNGGTAVAATGSKVIIPIIGTNFASPKVTITGTSGNVRVLGLASGTTSSHLNVIVRLPSSNDAAGAKVVTVKNHKAGSSTSSLSVDAAPTITSINTSSLFKGGSEDIAITGTGFRAGATLLEVPGVTWSNVTRNSSTSLTATAVVSATPTGTKRVIQVSNPSDGGVQHLSRFGDEPAQFRQPAEGRWLLLLRTELGDHDCVDRRPPLVEREPDLGLVRLERHPQLQHLGMERRQGELDHRHPLLRCRRLAR